MTPACRTKENKMSPSEVIQHQCKSFSKELKFNPNIMLFKSSDNYGN